MRSSFAAEQPQERRCGAPKRIKKRSTLKPVGGSVRINKCAAALLRSSHKSGGAEHRSGFNRIRFINGGDARESNPPRTALVCPTTVLKTEHHTSDDPSPA